MASSIVPPVDESRVPAPNSAPSADDATSSAPLAPLLEAQWALGWRHVAACACFCALFLYYNYIPLFHSDLWGHVHYGKWMLEHGQLVDEDPFMPFARGMHSANNAWLSQVILAKLHALGGPHYLSNLFAVVAVGAFVVHARTYFLLSGRLWLSVLGAVLLLLIGWSRHAIVRPEIFGNLAFALLLWLVVSGGDAATRGDRGERGTGAGDDGFAWRLWIGAPLLMFAWVNLHGSFAVGLVFLGCHALAVAAEEAWRTRSLLGFVQSPRLQRWGTLTALCVGATLLNPYGLDMLLETLRFGKNPNLKDVLEWYPLKLIDLEGVQFALSAALLLIALRWSPRRIRLAEILLFGVFVTAMAPTIRMIAWYAPVFLYLWIPHASAAWTRLERRLQPTWRRVREFAESLLKAEDAPAEAGTTDVAAAAAPVAADEASTATLAPAPEPRPALRFAATLVCGLMIWTTFAFSPISQIVLGGKTRPANRVYSRGTPLEATEYLREHPPTGVVFGPQWWGDWIAWDGPPGVQVFMTTHVHLAPHTVWRDYLRVARGLTGWQQTLDRYAVNTLVIDKKLQPALVDAVRGATGWKIVHEDEQAMIAERPGAAASAAAPASADAAPPADGEDAPTTGTDAERSPS